MGGVLTRNERMVADGHKYMTHLQALIDCYPSSDLSDAEKQHAFKAIEEHPEWVTAFLFDPKAISMRLSLIKGLLVQRRLQDPNRQHHYRGCAERIPPDAPPAVAPQAAAAPASASAAASSSIAEDAQQPPLVASESSSSSSAVSSAPVADEADEWTTDEELISLLAKKTQ